MIVLNRIETVFLRAVSRIDIQAYHLLTLTAVRVHLGEVIQVADHLLGEVVTHLVAVVAILVVAVTAVVATNIK